MAESRLEAGGWRTTHPPQGIEKLLAHRQFTDDHLNHARASTPSKGMRSAARSVVRSFKGISVFITVLSVSGAIIRDVL